MVVERCRGSRGSKVSCRSLFGSAASTYAIGHVSTGVDQKSCQHLYEWNGEEKASCADCAIRDRCNHFCGCLNKQATGRIDVVSPVLCAHERTVLPVADELAARLFKKKSAMFIQKHYNEMFPLVSLVEDSVNKP